MYVFANPTPNMQYKIYSPWEQLDNWVCRFMQNLLVIICIVHLVNTLITHVNIFLSYCLQGIHKNYHYRKMQWYLLFIHWCSSYKTINRVLLDLFYFGIWLLLVKNRATNNRYILGYQNHHHHHFFLWSWTKCKRTKEK